MSTLGIVDNHNIEARVCLEFCNLNTENKWLLSFIANSRVIIILPTSKSGNNNVN